MESARTTATNSCTNEFCVGRMASKIRLRKPGPTLAHAERLATQKRMSPPKSAAGFLLMDSSLSPVSFNAEAVQILGYPDNARKLASSDLLLRERIQSTLITRPSTGGSVFVKEFRSGRRRYFCRAFLIDSNTKEPSQPSIAVLLERGAFGLVPLSQIYQDFNLTQREQEALQYLLQGMRNKEIANQMNVSPHTIRAFLRLIMIKTGVSSRSALVGRIMMTQRQVLD